MTPLIERMPLYSKTQHFWREAVAARRRDARELRKGGITWRRFRRPPSPEAIVSRLTEDQQRMLYLRICRNMKCTQIAPLWGRTAETIRNHTNTALRKIAHAHNFYSKVWGDNAK